MTIGSLMEGGFRLIRERPGAMLIWTVIQLIAAIAASFAMMAILQGGVDARFSGDTAESVQTTVVVESLLVGLLGLLVNTILYAAVQRAIIRPDEGGPGWLKFGMDEIRFILLLLLFGLIFVVLALILGLFLGIFLVSAGAAAAALVMYIVGIIGGAMFATKLSLIFPLTLKERAFAIGDGLSLTRGRFWTLFGAYVITFVIMLVIGIASLAVTQPEYLSAILQHGFGSFEAQQASLLEYQKLMPGTIDAPIIIGWVLAALQGAIGCALWGGAAATAVQQLTADEAGLSETFS